MPTELGSRRPRPPAAQLHLHHARALTGIVLGLLLGMSARLWPGLLRTVVLLRQRVCGHVRGRQRLLLALYVLLLAMSARLRPGLLLTGVLLCLLQLLALCVLTGFILNTRAAARLLTCENTSSCHHHG